MSAPAVVAQRSGQTVGSTTGFFGTNFTRTMAYVIIPGRRGVRAGTISFGTKRFVAMLAVVVSTATAWVVVAVAPPAAADVRTSVATAVQYAHARGERAAVSVMDLKTGAYWAAGDHNSTYSSASLVKVMIAARLLLTGQMPAVQATAYKMITQSDDNAATALYGRAGGDGVLPWIARHYGIPNLGGPPPEPGWWGDTRVTSNGLVHLYAKIKADPRVAPWLLNAMHHATTYGSDGTFQFFGLPSATTGAAVKQGWTCCFGGRAGFHSSGFVNGDRYAVVILTSSAPNTYGRYAMDTITGVARRLLPSGRVENPNERYPFGKFDSATSAPNRTVTLTGWAYDRDNVAASINVAIYDNGRSLGWFKTTRSRLDVNRALRIGGLHGFAVAIPNVPSGTHKYCLYGINIGPSGPNPLIQCRTIGVSGLPLGRIERVAVTPGTPASVRVTGWAFDPDTTRSINVALYDNGRGLGWSVAGVVRADVNRAYRISGNHGYAITVPSASAGVHKYCVYGINLGRAGPNPRFQCSTVTVPT